MSDLLIGLTSTIAAAIVSYLIGKMQYKNIQADAAQTYQGMALKESEKRIELENKISEFNKKRLELENKVSELTRRLQEELENREEMERGLREEISELKIKLEDTEASLIRERIKTQELRKLISEYTDNLES